MTNTNTWAIYARVSTEDQAEKYSLPSQIRACREKAATHGAAVPDHLVFVDDCSGASVNRPSLKRLRELIDAGAINGIVVYTIDRLSRDVLDAVHYLRLCRRKNIKLEFCNLTIDDSPVGEFMFTLLAAVGQLERRTILERTANGRKEKWRKGFLASGQVPFGYRYRGKEAGSLGSMVIHDEEAKIVMLIFSMARSGMTIYGIRAQLIREGIKSPRGAMWNRESIAQMLRNPTYCGRATFQPGRNALERAKREAKQEGRQIDQTPAPAITCPCPAIIDELTFEAVRIQMQKNRAARVGRPSNKYLLTGLIWCGKCGKRFTTTPNRGKPIYRCSNADHFYKKRCDAAGISQKRIELAVWEAIWEAITRPKYLYELAQAYYTEMATPGAESRESMRRRIQRLERQEARDIEVLHDADIPYAISKKALAATQAELAIARDELAQCKVIEMPTRAAIEQICATIAAGRNLEAFENRRQFLLMVARKIEYANNEVRIEGAIRFNAAGAATGGSAEGGTQKNCKRRCASDYNSFNSIPFILKRRVA